MSSDNTLIALQPAHDIFGLLDELIQACRAEGIPVVTIAATDDLHPVLAQIPLTVRLQRLASHLANARGVDPDTVITGAWTVARLWTAGLP